MTEQDSFAPKRKPHLGKSSITKHTLIAGFIGLLSYAFSITLYLLIEAPSHMTQGMFSFKGAAAFLIITGAAFLSATFPAGILLIFAVMFANLFEEWIEKNLKIFCFLSITLLPTVCMLLFWTTNNYVLLWMSFSIVPTFIVFFLLRRNLKTFKKIDINV